MQVPGVERGTLGAEVRLLDLHQSRRVKMGVRTDIGPYRTDGSPAGDLPLYYNVREPLVAVNPESTRQEEPGKINQSKKIPH